MRQRRLVLTSAPEDACVACLAGDIPTGLGVLAEPQAEAAMMIRLGVPPGEAIGMVEVMVPPPGPVLVLRVCEPCAAAAGVQVAPISGAGVPADSAAFPVYSAEP